MSDKPYLSLAYQVIDEFSFEKKKARFASAFRLRIAPSVSVRCATCPLELQPKRELHVAFTGLAGHLPKG